MLWRNFIWGVVIISLMGSVAMADGLIGEVGISGGAIFPQGDYARYADPGGSFLLRVNSHMIKAQAFSAWINFGVNVFGSDETPIVISAGDDSWLGKKYVDEYGLSLHFGLQLGSDSRRGFFRPRAAIAPGLYLFNTETSIRRLDAEEDLVEINETQVRFGWKGSLGADFFFSTKWGISVELFYDQVVNMKRNVKIDDMGNWQEISASSRFNGFLIGVVIPFEQMEDE